MDMLLTDLRMEHLMVSAEKVPSCYLLYGSKACTQDPQIEISKTRKALAVSDGHLQW